MLFFDCFASVGRRALKDPAVQWSTEDLLRRMEYCGIHAALVTHGLAETYDPMFANDLLMKEVAKSERLHPCWVLMPHHTGECPEPAQAVSKMLEANVRAAKLFPAAHKYALDRRTCGGLLDALERTGILLLLEIGQATHDEVAFVCQEFPNLNVILQKQSWGESKKLFPLLDAFPNLCVEFSTWQASDMIEHLAQRIGAERLFFGTEFPLKSPGAARAFVGYSDIAAEQKRLIAGENLARLLAVEMRPYTDRSPADSVVARADKGEPLADFIVIDAHTHILHGGARGAGPTTMLGGDAAGLVRKNRLMGVDKCCISSWLGIFGDAALGNEVVLDAIKKYPDQFIGYVTYDPNYDPDPQPTIERWHEQERFPGLKPYWPRTQVPYDSPAYAPWFKYANEHRLFALLHPSSGFDNEVPNLCERYPEMSFLLAHTGGSFASARRHISLAKKCPNVFLEITLTPVTLGVIEFMVGEIGAERVLFGTDAPMRDPRPQFGWVTYAEIPEEAKRLILGGNMQAILARCRW